MFRNFFRGRYGPDTITYVLLFGAVLFSNIKYMWIISICLLGYAIFRALSKDVNRRYQELQKFRQFTSTEGMKLKKFFLPLWNKLVVYKTRLQQRKHYVFFSCPKCKNTLRLPRNKGRLQVTCPVCGLESQRKT